LGDRILGKWSCWGMVNRATRLTQLRLGTRQGSRKGERIHVALSYNSLGACKKTVFKIERYT